MSFWIEKNLSQLSKEEWESLCDGCGKCCLNKIIDDDTDELYYTDARCHLLNAVTCRCKNYSERFAFVPECTSITLDNIAELDWLPESCAYRRLYLGESLPSWHPLIVGNSERMHELGMSVSHKTISESKVKYLEDRIVTWPLEFVE